MRTGFFKGVVLGAIVSTVVLLAAVAMAGTGIGGVFNLGQSNSVNATTTLVGSSGQTLHLDNTGNGPALGLHVKANQPPLTTNSLTKATNLNADFLDGISSGNFVQGAGKILRAQKTQSNPTGETTVLTVPTFGSVNAACDGAGADIRWVNGTATTELVWSQVNGFPNYVSLAHDAETGIFTNQDTQQMATVQITYPGHVATVMVASHSSGLGGCQYAIQAIVQ